METITGYVDHIIYRNADNGYTVLVLVCEEEEITCVGIFSGISEGENIEVTGEYTAHPTYGKQFKAESYVEKEPTDELSIERYLGSGAIKGIGAALAARIVRRFKGDTFRIIEEEPERLAEVKGISERKAMEISDQVSEKRDLRQAMIFLQQYGITLNLAVKIYKEYGQEVYGIIQENPYRLADDISGVGFRIADEIAKKVGIHTDSDFRIQSGILYTLLQASGEGHTFLPEEELTKRAGELLGVTEEAIEKQYMDLSIERKIIMKQEGEQVQIYGAPLYYTEVNTAMMLKNLDIAYDVSAAKRMSEMTGYEAKTIHRMLELNGGMEGAVGFERNESNPLETDVVIIDEMSMVDISLMQSLLKAMVAGTRLILVGDVNQLPSVGPGSVLKDIIDSGQFHVVQLTKIFRQASQSDIIVNAHKINRGEEVVLDNKSMDFFFLKRYDADVIINVVLQLIMQKLPKFVNAQPYDIQVLTPMKKGNLGVERLNAILQRYLNPPAPDKKEKEYGDKVFREGDKVMQIKNNYQLEWEVLSKYGFAIDRGTGVFNGDTGIIREINDYKETMTVVYDEDKVVEYSFKILEELELAYAITIHKSQGSEYPAVVIPLLGGPRMLMNRNLLYTAVTRARKCVTLVGNEMCFYEMEQNITEQTRYSGLRARLEENV